jgi:transcriptional regulator with XRE-family HTH domain
MAPTEQGLLIKTARQTRLWSVRRLAREAGLSAGYISQLENGTRPVTARVMARVAEALGLPSWLLLTKAGFIPEEHLTEAKQMAEKGMTIPSIHAQATGADDRQKLEWLIADYLLLLGDDLSGIGAEAGALPCPPGVDWTPLVPDAPPTMATVARASLNELLTAQHLPRTPTAIEGWDDLSDADRAFVQQMVNKLRRSATGE